MRVQLDVGEQSIGDRLAGCVVAFAAFVKRQHSRMIGQRVRVQRVARDRRGVWTTSSNARTSESISMGRLHYLTAGTANSTSSTGTSCAIDVNVRVEMSYCASSEVRTVNGSMMPSTDR